MLLETELTDSRILFTSAHILWMSFIFRAAGDNFQRLYLTHHCTWHSGCSASVDITRLRPCSWMYIIIYKGHRGLVLFKRAQDTASTSILLLTGP